MSLVYWGLAAFLVSGLLGLAIYSYRKYRFKPKNTTWESSTRNPDTDQIPYKISYAPSDRAWSGSISGIMPLRTLTYKQYECLEDARYGFKIVGITPTERKKEQPHKTRAHGAKTVASLLKHGFLTSDGADGQVITDHGLNALEVCDVRY